MRQCHIDKYFNFWPEESKDSQGNCNTLECNDQLYECIVAMQTLYSAPADMFDPVDPEFHDTYDQLKARVLLEEVARLRQKVEYPAKNPAVSAGKVVPVEFDIKIMQHPDDGEIFLCETVVDGDGEQIVPNMTITIPVPKKFVKKWRR